MNYPSLTRLKGALALAHSAPLRVKVVLILTVVYLAVPIDIIPDFIPVLGQLDDILVIGIAARYVLKHVPELAEYLPKVPSRYAVRNRRKDDHGTHHHRHLH